MENKITQGYELFLEATKKLQGSLNLSFFESFIENGGNIIENFTTRVEEHLPDEQTELELNKIYQELKALTLEPEEWRKVAQLVLLFGIKEEPIQANHQMTPDSIAFLFAYFIEQLKGDKKEIILLDNTVGMANGLLTVINQLSLSKIKVKAIGVENDDLLIDIASVNATLSKADIEFFLQDGARRHESIQADFAIGDMPIGFYPDDQHAQKFLTGSTSEHTFAHHLLVEQAMLQVKENGYGIFLLPSELFKSKQADLMIQWMKEKVYLQAVIQLPENLFKQKNSAKSIFIFQNHGALSKQKTVLASNLSSLTDKKKIEQFFKEFANWKNN
ncbi:MAG: class I SAM-dependent methyltransferase [Streptococcaceae bacterium]|nr:class I SAM-dependent methyltransferase [Streptococcaceae bacterium]